MQVNIQKYGKVKEVVLKLFFEGLGVKSIFYLYSVP